MIDLPAIRQRQAAIGFGRADDAGALSKDVTALLGEVEELRLTLDNERGLGTPPSGGWYWDGEISGGIWTNRRHYRDLVYRFDGQWKRAHPGLPSSMHPTARAAMIAADEAAKLNETKETK